MRLKEVAAKEKVRLQFQAMKSSRSKTPSGKPPSKVMAESKEKAEPKKKTPQTKCDDVSKIQLVNERTRNHFLLRTGVKRKGQGSVQWKYDPKSPGGEKAAKTAALSYLRAFCKYNGTPLPPRGITS